MSITILAPTDSGDVWQIWISMEAPAVPTDVLRMQESFCIGRGLTLSTAIREAQGSFVDGMAQLLRKQSA